MLEIEIEPGALQLVRPALASGDPTPAPPLPAAIAGVRLWAPVLLGTAGLAALGYTLWRRRSRP